MEIRLTDQQSAEQSQPGTADGSLWVDDDILVPIMEGARARGVADAFEMTGQGAILLNAAGGVLHVTAAARARLGPDLSVSSGHLVARTALANHAIQDLLAGLLDRGTGTESLVLNGINGLPGLRIKGLTFPAGSRSDYQLLAAVLLIGDSDLGEVGFVTGATDSAG